MNNTYSSLNKAKIIGTITILSYVSNYFLRNMLSVLTPFMLKNDFYSKEYLALLSSIYMAAYAIGQLFNGVLGDIFKPKTMVMIGLVSAGAASVIFPFMPGQTLQIVCFFILGYALSMCRGPLMKIISENTEAKYARVICVFFSFAGFAGPLIASLIAMAFNWISAFVFAGFLTVLIAIGTYISLTVLEKKNMITFQSLKGASLKGMLGVFKIEKFTFYLITACLVEISAASVSFWIPTFLTEYVNIDENSSNLVFSFISLARAVTPFIALAIFKLFNERDIFIMKASYIASFLSFVVMLLVPIGWFTVVFLLLALVMNSIVSALLWSIYIPSLGKTGRVSSVNGILDCTGYITASIATTIFAQIVVRFNWTGLIISWGIIQIIGLAASLFENKKSAN